MEEKTDVTQASSPAPEQEVSSEVAETAQPQEEVIDVSGVPLTPPVPGQGQQPEEELDERGVSYKNVAEEYKRKLANTDAQLGEMKSMLQTIQEQSQSKQEEETYTIADLTAYAQQHPEQAAWCEQEKARLMQEETVKAVRQEFETRAQQQQAEQIKQSTLQQVAATYPQLFTKDRTGQVNWNLQDPMTQRLQQYAQDPSIANRPDGLALAAKMAYADVATLGLAQAGQQVKQAQAVAGDLQRKVAIEAGNIGSVNSATPRMQAINTLRETGDRTAARSALKQMMLDSGKLK